MYNPYLPHTWAEPERAVPPPPPPGPPPSGEGPLEGLLGKLPGGLLDKFRDLDTGDILLILLILYLFWEDKEDHLELIITLGLMLIL